jgi:hypothetical protein
MWGGLETTAASFGRNSFQDELTGANAPFCLFFGIILSFDFVVIVSALREQPLLQRGNMSPKSLSDVKRKDLVQSKGYIAREWAPAASGKAFDMYDPVALNKIATIPEMGKEDTTKVIKAAHETIQPYKKTTARQRARWLRE